MCVRWVQNKKQEEKKKMLLLQKEISKFFLTTAIDIKFKCRYSVLTKPLDQKHSKNAV